MMSIGRVTGQVGASGYNQSFGGLRVVIPPRVLNEYLSERDAVKGDVSLGEALQKLFGWSSILLPKGSKTKINNAILEFTNGVSRHKGENWQRSLQVNGFDFDGDIYVRAGLEGNRGEALIPITDIQSGVRSDIADSFSIAYERLLQDAARAQKSSKLWRNDERAVDKIWNLEEGSFVNGFVDKNPLISLAKTSAGTLTGRKYSTHYDFNDAKIVVVPNCLPLGGMSKIHLAFREYAQIAKKQNFKPIVVQKCELKRDVLIANVALKDFSDRQIDVPLAYLPKGVNSTLTAELVAAHEKLTGKASFNTTPFSEEAQLVSVVKERREPIQTSWTP